MSNTNGIIASIVSNRIFPATRANITTNEPGTESQNPSFIVLQSSQLPAAEISRQLQTEEDLAAGQQQEQPLEPAELPAPQPAKSIAAPPRKSVAQPVKSRRPPQPPAPQQPQQVLVPVKARRPAQTQQPIAAPQPAKRLVAAPAKGAIRSRAPSKSIAAPTTTTTTQRPRPVAAPAKRPQQQIQQQPQLQEEETAQLSQSADQGEDAADEESSQEGF